MKPIQKVAEVENSLREMFKRQQQELQYMSQQNSQPQQQQHQQQPMIKTEEFGNNNHYPSLSRKNVQLFEQQYQGEPFPSVSYAQQQQQQPGDRKNSNRYEMPGSDPQTEINKLKATINKYEIMVFNLMQKLRNERENYKVAIKELSKTNDSLRGDLVRLAETFKAMNEKRKEEQKDLAKFKEETDSLANKNHQLEQDLAKMVTNVQTSDNLLTEMNKKLIEKQTTSESLSSEKNHLQEQIQTLQKDIVRYTESRASHDSRSKSRVRVYKEKILGSNLGRFLTTLFLLVVGISFLMRSSDAAAPYLGDECEYDSEIFL